MTADSPLSPAPIDEPFTKTELLRDLDAVRAWSLAYWRGFDQATFFAPAGGGWAPADDVRHLVKSNRPVARALAMPKVLLALRFGIALRPSRSYSQVREVYHRALGNGLKAGSYAPRPLTPEEQTAESRERTLSTLDGTFAALARGLAEWSERALDRLRLPHPGIGLLTVREIVGWTIYHNTHHVANVVRRLQPAPTGVS